MTEPTLDIERHNLRQIEMLNQRGGRTLSVVDLVRAGTISLEMAACAMRAIHQGASLLTGARPGGAGKTTLMAALLGFLPPGVPIVTVDRPKVIREAKARPLVQPACYLAHEIGSGNWYGYLWGHEVADFLSLADGPRRVASCLHADTIEELTAILCSPPLNVTREVLGRVGLILFMHVAPSSEGPRRRVAAFHQSDRKEGHVLRFAWDRESDTFQDVGWLADADQLGPYRDFLRDLLADGQSEYQSVRRKVLGFYLSGGGR